MDCCCCVVRYKITQLTFLSLLDRKGNCSLFHKRFQFWQNPQQQKVGNSRDFKDGVNNTLLQGQAFRWFLQPFFSKLLALPLVFSPNSNKMYLYHVAYDFKNNISQKLEKQIKYCILEASYSLIFGMIHHWNKPRFSNQGGGETPR